MTEEQKEALGKAATVMYSLGYYAESRQIGALLAAGASEGQAEPIYQVKRVHGWVDVPESRYTEIKEDPNDCGELRILYLHPSAEIAALRERIAGMEKDAERWRAWLPIRDHYRWNVCSEKEATQIVDDTIAEQKEKNYGRE